MEDEAFPHIERTARHRGLEMKKIDSDEMKQLELNMLVDVAAFCDNHGIRYYLGGGTLLGAVRHKGFIPWDDDVDISMPRPDYLKFVKTYNGSHEFYHVQSIENNDKYWRTFAKVFDTRTYLKEDAIRIPKEGNGVFIDVFPVDGLPSDKISQFILFKEQEFLNFLYHASAWNYTMSHKYRDSMGAFANLKGLIRTFLKFIAITLLHPLPTIKLIKILNDNASKWEFDKAQFVGAIVDCAHGAACEKIARDHFEPRIKFVFENHEFWGSKGYDEYLTNLYGDYMKLPPMDRRETHHDFEAYWKEGEIL